MGTIGRRAPRWRVWNRYRVPGGGGKVGDNRRENATVAELEQVQSPWGLGKGWGRSEGERHSGGAGTGTESLGVGHKFWMIGRRMSL